MGAILRWVAVGAFSVLGPLAGDYFGDLLEDWGMASSHPARNPQTGKPDAGSIERIVTKIIGAALLAFVLVKFFPQLFGFLSNRRRR